jgi:hypothetical protein
VVARLLPEFVTIHKVLFCLTKTWVCWYELLEYADISYYNFSSVQESLLLHLSFMRYTYKAIFSHSLKRSNLRLIFFFVPLNRLNCPLIFDT